MNNVKVDNSSCLKSCSGFIVSSFAKSEPNKNLESLFPIFREYNNYKNVTTYPSGANSMKHRIIQLKFNIIFNILDYEWKNKLRLLRIYFDTPTFDRITKDRAAKFLDMLSAIGGTMGLLTGFSIISGVEILYFAAKIGWNIIQKNKSKRRK